MESDSQHGLRLALRGLADEPVPPDIADRALAGAVSLRRRHRILTAVAALGAVGLIGGAGAAAIPLLGGPSGDPTVPPGASSGAAPTPLMCQTATNEPAPPAGERAGLPAVARIVLDLLPPRDDYQIGWAFTACEQNGRWVYPDGSPLKDGEAVARVQIWVGSDSSGERVNVELYRESYLDAPTCAALPAPQPGEERLFCEDSVGGPMLLGVIFHGEKAVVSVFADGRGVLVENAAPSIDIDLMRAIATDPDLLALVN